MTTGGRRHLLEIAGLIAFLTGAFLMGTRFLALPWVVEGDSMEPALRPGDRVVVDRWTYGWRLPRPGEVVLIRGPGAIPMVKRARRGPPDAAPGTVWVEGDNRGWSRDSRHFGPLPRRAVRGRIRGHDVSEKGPGHGPH